MKYVSRIRQKYSWQRGGREMTYRELLRLYKQGKLEDSAKKQIEAEIEKQEII